MANADRPQGFRPKGPVQEQVRAIAGARVFPGDAVALAATGKVSPATAGVDIYGVALDYADADGDEVLLSVAMDQLYICQADEAEIDDQTDVGQPVDLLATAGDTTYNVSRQELDSSTIGTGGQFIVLGIDRRVDNALGDKADVLCKVNEHQIFGENDSAGV